MDKAKAAEKRAKIYPKMQRAYAKAMRKTSGDQILAGFEATSDTDEIASLISRSDEVGRAMRGVDAKRKWPVELDVGSVLGMWQQDWGMAAVFAIGRAFDKRDGTDSSEGGIYGLIESRLEQFTGTDLGFQRFLSKSESQQVASFLQEVLDGSTAR